MRVSFHTDTDMMVLSEIESTESEPEVIEAKVLFNLCEEMEVVLLAHVHMVTAVTVLVGFELAEVFAERQTDLELVVQVKILGTFFSLVERGLLEVHDSALSRYRFEFFCENFVFLVNKIVLQQFS